MRVFLIDGKKLGVTIIIVGLMLIMFGFSKQLDSGLRYVALVQSDMTTLKSYNILNSKFEYKLPSDWTTNYEKFDESQIVYHNNFTSKDSKITGVIELWNNNENLKDFLYRSKDVTAQNSKIKNYSLEQVKINDKDGYLATYITSNNSTNISHKCIEYFLKDDNGFIRVSFFVANNDFKENMPTIFRAIVDTIKNN